MKSIIDDCFSFGFLLRLVFGPFARLLLEFFNVRFGDSCSLLSFGLQASPGLRCANHPAALLACQSRSGHRTRQIAARPEGSGSAAR